MFRRYKVAIVPTQVFLNAAGQESPAMKASKGKP